MRNIDNDCLFLQLKTCYYFVVLFITSYIFKKQYIFKCTKVQAS